MPSKTIVIIGSSIAGLSAAEEARAQDPACDIIILSEDSFLPYYRQRLCEVLEDPSKAEKLSIHPKEWYEAQRFDLRLNHKVSGILPGEKAVVLWDGGRIRYDRLILATGSSSFVPPIKGADLPGVVTMWTMADTLGIERMISGARPRSVVSETRLTSTRSSAMRR